MSNEKEDWKPRLDRMANLLETVEGRVQLAQQLDQLKQTRELSLAERNFLDKAANWGAYVARIEERVSEYRTALLTAHIRKPKAL